MACSVRMAAAWLAERTLDCHAGMPTPTRIPIMAITIINSMSENPRSLLLRRFKFWCIFTSSKKWWDFNNLTPPVFTRKKRAQSFVIRAHTGELPASRRRYEFYYIAARQVTTAEVGG